MTYHIDLKIRNFTASQKAYRLFPGLAYRHYDAMRHNSVIFLDLPSFPAATAVPYEQSDAMVQAIAKSDALSSSVFRQDGEDRAERISEALTADYNSARWTPRRAQQLAWAKALYETAQPGDIVVVPGNDTIEKNESGRETVRGTLIGEIIGSPERWTGIGQYADAHFLVRRVKWLTIADERDLTRRTRRALRTQNALVNLPTDELKAVLGAAYKNVVVGNDVLARFLTGNEEFTASESFHFQAFVMAVVAAMKKIEDHEEILENTNDQARKSFYELAGTVRGQNFDHLVPEQDASIHSPGYTTLKSKNILPFVVAGLFALANAANGQPTPDEQLPVIVVKNSESDSYDPCAAGIDDKMKQVVELWGYSVWQEACRAAELASEDDGLSSIATVTHEAEIENDDSE